MLTRRSMLGVLGLAPFAAKALANAKPEPIPPPVILPPKGPPAANPNTSTATTWLYVPVYPRNVYVARGSTDLSTYLGKIHDESGQ